MQRLKFNKNNFFSTLLALLLLVAFFGCEKAFDVKTKKFNPINVFDESWKVIDQHYALFSVKGVDWDEAYKEFRPQINTQMTDKDLFIVISKMLQKLKDGHVTLISALDTFTYEGFYKTFPKNFNYENILKNYLKNDYQVSGPVVYKIQGNIGYIYYNSFGNDISDEQVSKVFNEMENTKGIIIDVRNNRGGKSTNAEKFFARLIAERKLVKYEVVKKGPQHSDFFEPEPFSVSPIGKYYGKPICVLTNRGCFSSCNDFVLYLSQLSNVKIVGDQTGGGGGIPYNYILVNGWKIQYTATLTLSPQKLSIENGILPGINIGINAIEENNGKDPILEKAYLLLQ